MPCGAEASNPYGDRLGVSQEELAFRAGVHRTYLGAIERGEKNPSYTNILKVAGALDVDAWELLRRAKRLGD